MFQRILASSVAAITLGIIASPAHAVRLPNIEASGSNATPACVTPGRLMAFVRTKNPRFAPQFSDISLHYMSIGQELGVRWDYAFYQMLVETGFLKYGGDVKPSQNNFAGIGATGGGVPGESFPTVAEGVRAHLQHLMLYAGMPIDNPVAERTRKVQSWGIMRKWKDRLGGPVRYDQMSSKWAPYDKGYPRDLKAVASRFMNGPCLRPDPAPELIAGIRDGSQRPATATTYQASNTNASVATLRPSQQSRSSLGAPLPDQNAARSGRYAPVGSANAEPNYAVINGGGQQSSRRHQPSTALTPTISQTRTQTVHVPVRRSERGADTRSGAQDGTRGSSSSVGQSVGRFASNLFASITPSAVPKQNVAEPKSCRVWTASYGGQRALIIKSVSASHVNYTVLDVNKGRERREADAYIAAYAKGGETIATFGDPQAALAKAFKLCPSGNKAS